PPTAAAAEVLKEFTKETGKPIEWDTVRNVCFDSLSAEHDYMRAHNLTVPAPPGKPQAETPSANLALPALAVL
ncbi:MAG TPA: hypothetical protein VKU87_11770, partial [Thermomicrobiaceae bacterium]|nr:hypothetical protein [Thermomicrobiaceae bacterium]